MANMIAAFFEKTVKAGNVFGRMQIARLKVYSAHLNQHLVIQLEKVKDLLGR